MYLMIGIWGSQKNKILPPTVFSLYLLGSFFLLVAFSWYFFWRQCQYFFLRCFLWDPSLENVLFFLFFVSFASRYPCFLSSLVAQSPCEAPTVEVFFWRCTFEAGLFGFLRYSSFFFHRQLCLFLDSSVSDFLAVAYSSSPLWGSWILKDWWPILP